MSEMQRRVALAIWKAREETFEPRLRRMAPDNIDFNTGAWAIVWAMAGAAIGAMREPTLKMVQAGWATNGYRGDMTEREWTAMIDAALEDR